MDYLLMMSKTQKSASEIYEFEKKHNFLISSYIWDKIWIDLNFLRKK